MQLLTVITALSLPLARGSPQFQCKQENFTVGQIVDTSSGAVAGHAATNYSEVSEYLGIPYAQAPVGDLRFAAPVKYPGSGRHNGSVFGFSCPTLPSQQTPPTASEIAASNITTVGLELINLITNQHVLYNEDCLYLNVWSKPQTGEAQKAVMVFMYGGGFDSGTSSLPIYNGATLADQEDVIIVTFNYRLSILGFPGNPLAQNNVAFLDQRLAVEWIQENIAGFGGDPARITLFGQSAGAISADYYAYAWNKDPIVSGIILQSGTTSSFGLPYPQSVSATSWYAVTAFLGCGDASTDPTTLLACMRDVEVDSLLSAVSSTAQNPLLGAFAPTVDNAIVFSDYPQQTPASIPVLVGSNDYESGEFRTELALANETFSDAIWDAFTLAAFTCPAGLRANASVAANIPTWKYRYFGVWENTNISSEGRAWHGAELQLIFGTTYLTGKSTVEEMAFEKYLRGAWTTFAKDPANGLMTYEAGWPSYDPTKESLIRLAYDNLVGTNLAFPMLYDSGCVDANITALECSVFGGC